MAATPSKWSTQSWKELIPVNGSGVMRGQDFAPLVVASVLAPSVTAESPPELVIVFLYEQGRSCRLHQCKTTAPSLRQTVALNNSYQIAQIRSHEDSSTTHTHAWKHYITLHHDNYAHRLFMAYTYLHRLYYPLWAVPFFVPRLVLSLNVVWSTSHCTKNNTSVQTC